MRQERKNKYVSDTQEVMEGGEIDHEYFSNIHEDLIQLNNMNTNGIKWTDDLNRYLTEELKSIINKHMKRFLTSLVIRVK